MNHPSPHGGMEYSAGPDASTTTATPMAVSRALSTAIASDDRMAQDLPATPVPDAQSVPGGLSPSMASPKTPLPHAQSPVGESSPKMDQDPTDTPSVPVPDAYISKSTPHQNAPTPVADEPMDLGEPTAEDNDLKTSDQTPAAPTSMQGDPSNPENDPSSATPPTKTTTPLPKTGKSSSSTTPATNNAAPTKLGPSQSKPTASSSKNTDRQSSTEEKHLPAKKTPKNIDAAAKETNAPKSKSTMSTGQQVIPSDSPTRNPPKKSGSGATTSDKSSATKGYTGRCQKVVPSQPAASSSKKNPNAPLKIKKDEDRFNDLIMAGRTQGRKPPPRVIYWDITELMGWPQIDVGAVASRNVRVHGFHVPIRLLTRAPGCVCVLICELPCSWQRNNSSLSISGACE